MILPPDVASSNDNDTSVDYINDASFFKLFLPEFVIMQQKGVETKLGSSHVLMKKKIKTILRIFEKICIQNKLLSISEVFKVEKKKYFLQLDELIPKVVNHGSS